MVGPPYRQLGFLLFNRRGVGLQVVEHVPDLSRVSPAEVKRYVDNQIRRQTRIITFLIRLMNRLMIFFYVAIIYRLLDNDNYYQAYCINKNNNNDTFRLND